MKIIYAFLLAALFTGCVSDKITHKPASDEAEWNDFSFTTVDKTRVAVDYNTPTEVYFEIYDTTPVRENADGTGYVRIDGPEPLYAGYTDGNGHFAETLDLPSYLETAYIFTPEVYVQTLLTAKKENGALTASAYIASDVEPAAAATRANYDSNVVKGEHGWKTWLGEYSSRTGKIDYDYTGALQEKNWWTLLPAISKVFNIDKSCPAEYRSSSDLYLDESAEVAITFLMSNTCWNSSMGYYYYDASSHPASLDDVQVIMLFPNTQDGQWAKNPQQAARYKGVSRGTAVQLMYYPNIAQGSKEGATTAFPKGYRIGFVLASNAWGNTLPGFSGEKKYRAATSSGLSIDNNGNSIAAPRTAVYRYTNSAADLNSVICSFEDYTTDENFSDVIFTMKSNPVDAVIDIPSVEEKPGAQKEVRLLKGIYAFEDLWPSRGDYDMNDVMASLNYEKTFDNKGLFKESFLLKTFNNFAGLENGLAFTFSGTVAPSALEFSILRPADAGNTAPEYEMFTPVQIDGNVVLLTANVKENMGATYKIMAKYASAVAETDAAVFKPFIYRTQDEDITPGKRKEVHLPFEAPTDKIDEKFFGTSDDRSDPAENRYYVRAQSYPFAIYLAGATEANLSKLLDRANEKTPIDRIYPSYKAWVASNGTTNTDWYK